MQKKLLRVYVIYQVNNSCNAQKAHIYINKIYGYLGFVIETRLLTVGDRKTKSMDLKEQHVQNSE